MDWGSQAGVTIDFCLSKAKHEIGIIVQNPTKTYSHIPWYMSFKAFPHPKVSDDDICFRMIGSQFKSGNGFVLVRIVNQARELLHFLFVNLGWHDVDLP